MAVVMWFSKLKSGVDPEAYEEWVRRTDYALAQEIDCILSYKVYRVEGPFQHKVPGDYDYIEIVKITDLDAYREALQNHPSMDVIISQINTFVVGTGDVICHEIEA